MDDFFLDSVCQEEDDLWDLIADDISGYDDKSVVSVPDRSAFRSYVKGTEPMLMNSSKVNVKKRMVNLLRKNWEEKKNAVAPEKERCRRHMLKERTRREKQKQSYLALHSLLPFATKNDKNTIVEKAVGEIAKLQRLKKELERRIKMIEAKPANDRHNDMSETKVRFSLQEPLSGLHSMVEVLQCLKSMGTKLKTVHANFSSHEFYTTMNIETKEKRWKEEWREDSKKMNGNFYFSRSFIFFKD